MIPTVTAAIAMAMVRTAATITPTMVAPLSLLLSDTSSPVVQ